MIPSGEKLFFLILLSTHVYYSFARDIISPTQSLADGETLVSAGGSFVLGFFSPNNAGNKYIGIWYNKDPLQTVVWVANRQNPITSNTTSLTITPQGTLSIIDHNSTVILPVALANISNPIAQLLDDGNFVVRYANSKNEDNFSWQSFDYPTDTFLPGMKLGWNLKTGLNRRLVSWISASDPSPGTYFLAIDIRGGHELTGFQGSKIIWQSGIWNGVQFSGIPDLKTYGDFNVTFVNNTDEIYVTYQMTDPSTIAKIVVNSTGITQRAIWLDSANSWNVIWSTPNSRCDPYNVCGSNGKCDTSTLPVCQCLPGFVPKSPVHWDLRDTSDGCIRKTPLACGNKSIQGDGFMKLSNMVLPHTTLTMIDTSMSLDECEANCLRNCSCTAYANANVLEGGSGCIMWVSELDDSGLLGDGGQDLYIRLAAADLPPVPPQKEGQSMVIIIVSLILGILLLSCVGCCVWRRKRRTIKGLWNEASNNEDEDLELPLYDLDILAAATDNFSEENKLGEGGFGPVYKGKLLAGQEIAVKRLSKYSNQGTDEFKNEVSLIAKLQHRNLVRLLGCCTQGEERMLIYEYMPNKSLDAVLFDKTESVNLDWRTRYHIITGIARGLLYLHQDSRFRIIHRDLKPSNILLDKEMNPKISDFGLARIFGNEEASAKTRRVVGTYGYMSPEYALDGIFSVKSDVFSFGVLALEIISGQRNKAVFLSELEANLLGKAWRLWREGKSVELIDPSMGSDFSLEEVFRCMNIGLLCVQENPEARPTMLSVVLMLSNQKDSSFQEPEEPGFVARKDMSYPHSSSSPLDSASVNEISFTNEGR